MSHWPPGNIGVYTIKEWTSYSILFNVVKRVSRGVNKNWSNQSILTLEVVGGSGCAAGVGSIDSSRSKCEVLLSVYTVVLPLCPVFVPLSANMSYFYK